AAGDQFGRLRGRAAVGEFERHDLSLLSDAEAAPNRARGLCRDRPPGRGAAPAHRAPAAVEEGDGNAALAPQPGEPELSLGELPVGRQKPAVLVGVGVADHHLEHPPLFPLDPANLLYLEQLHYLVYGGHRVVIGIEPRDAAGRRALHSACSASYRREEISRISNRNVLNRKASTSRRTGRTNSPAAVAHCASVRPASKVRRSTMRSSAVA